jgi:hypothetical protein
MLDHDELLPEEEAYPDLVQELQATYQMKPEEKLVLSRVHQRLAESSHPLPLPELAQAGGQTRPFQFSSSAAAPSRPARARQRWLRPLNAFAAVLILGLLVGSLVVTFVMIGHTRVGSPPATMGDIRVFLVPAERGSTPSHTELETVSSILSQRFSDFGFEEFRVQVTTSNGQTGIFVELPHFGGNEQQIIDTLLGTGKLDFWGTGKTAVLGGTLFNPSQYAQYNPSGQPRFTGQDLDPNSLATSQDKAGRPQINGRMKGDAIQRFQLYTAHNIGNYLTVTLDGKVLQSAVIESSISGPFVIFGLFTQQQARAIVSALKYGTLPFELKQQV